MSEIPKCNLTLNDREIYSSGAAGVGGAIGGFFGIIINGILSIILFIVYLISKNNIILAFTACTVISLIYSYFQMTAGGKNLPERPCTNMNNEILN
jgi:hypothetical protein